jgi:hypothetical protein
MSPEQNLQFFVPARAIVKNPDGTSCETSAVLVRWTPKNKGGAPFLMRVSTVFVLDDKSQKHLRQVPIDFVQWPDGEPKPDNP